jgi:hypothetical protein
MKINFNLTDAARKPLMRAIKEHLGVEWKYCGAPTFAYKIGAYEVSRYGVLSSKNSAVTAENAALLAFLAKMGFVGEDKENAKIEPSTASHAEVEPLDTITIEVPFSGNEEIYGHLSRARQA